MAHRSWKMAAESGGVAVLVRVKHEGTITAKLLFVN
jgi:hypothetical protein